MPKGFFQREDIHSSVCGLSCKLNRSCRCPRMAVGGKGRRGIMVVGEAPGATEDERGEQKRASNNICPEVSLPFLNRFFGKGVFALVKHAVKGEDD